MKTEAEIRIWVSQLDAGSLMRQYDMMNCQRAGLASGGSHLPMDELKQIEHLSFIINLMNDRITELLKLGARQEKLNIEFDKQIERRYTG